jgi:hypothetical protein
MFLQDLVGKLVVLGQDDGLDVGLVRAVQALPSNLLVPHYPECAYMPVFREANREEMEGLFSKQADEKHALKLAREIVRHLELETMDVKHCEFQFDRKKIIVYAHLKQWTHFNDFVKTLHVRVENELGYVARVFVQRKFMN